MNEQLIKFIELCLVDGVISDKEREVIFRKSDEFGVPRDECEIILEGLVHKLGSNVETEKTERKTSEEKNVDVEIQKSYVDIKDVKRWLNNLEKVEERIKYLDENLEKLFNDFKNENLENYIKNDSFVKGKFTLNKLLSMDGGIFRTKSKQSFEFIKRDKINDILKKETFLGYVGAESIKDTNLIEEYYSTGHYDRLLYTNKKMYCFRGIKGDIRLEEQDYYVEYDKILSPIKYYVNQRGKEYLFLNGEIEDYMKNHHISKTFSYVHCEDFCISNFFKDFIEKSDLDIVNELQNLKMSINQNLFLEKIKSQDLPDELINQLMRINDYIDRSVNDFNFTISNLKSKQVNIINEERNRNLNVNELPGQLMMFYKSKIEHILSILQLRDNLLNMYLKNERVSGQEIYLKLENLGVFLNKFERVSLEKLDRIITVLNEINDSIIEGFSSLSSSVDNLNTSLNTSLSSMSKSLDSINSSIGLNNLIQGVSTYQLYKINKSLKQ